MRRNEKLCDLLIRSVWLWFVWNFGLGDVSHIIRSLGHLEIFLGLIAIAPLAILTAQQW